MSIKSSSPNDSYLSQLVQIIGCAGLILGLDILTKSWVVNNLRFGESWAIIPGLERLFQITHVTNTGAAFGLFPQFGNVFLLIAVVVVAGILFFHHQLPLHEPWIRLSLALQLGGAIGNGLDRLTRGAVIDFVDIGFWPIFNVADVAIVSGVAILAYLLWDEDDSDLEAAHRPISKGGELS